MSGYESHPDVADDLADIAQYIARNSSPDAAARVVGEILEAVALLADSPGIGHRRDDLAARPLRFWPVHDYLIAYVPDEEPLWVIAVLHGRRNPRLLAAILRERE